MKFNRATIIDLECTCWPDSPPFGEQMEIIEIGACLYDKELGLTKKKSILVKPEYSKISPFCTELTGHTFEELKRYGVPFSDAIHTLQKNYPLKSCPWLSWGDFDRIQFEKDCFQKEIEYPF